MCFYDSQLVRVSGGTPTGPQVSVPSPPLSLSTAESVSGPLRWSSPGLPQRASRATRETSNLATILERA
jgi:hypothetical protein